MNDRKPPALAFTEFERALLRSADGDEAPRGGAARALVALGFGTSHAAISQSAGGAIHSTAPAPSAAWSLWQKPLLIGVLGGVGVALSARLVEHPAPRFAPPAVLAPAATSTPVHAAPQPSPAPHPVAPRAAKAPGPKPVRAKTTPTAALAPALPSAPHEPTPAVSALVLPPPVPLPDAPPRAVPDSVGTTASGGGVPSPSIAAEVMVVDGARAALRDGRAREALAQLARYREQWPLGVLTPEVTVLQIEAELRLGARESAKRRARDLIAAQPNSRYAARLRTLFGESELR